MVMAIGHRSRALLTTSVPTRPISSFVAYEDCERPYVLRYNSINLISELFNLFFWTFVTFFSGYL